MLTGDHEFNPTPTKEDPKPNPIPVLEFERETPPFAWMASAWHALDELALADPQVGDVVRVARLADRGRSHQFDIRIAQSANGAKPADADTPIDTSGLDEKFGDKPPWDD